MGTPTVGGVARPAVAEAAEVTRLVRGLRWIARSAVRTFYSSVEATGLENVDPARPTLYAPTHPNSIIDPLLVALFEERPICFVARDGLFDVPVFGAVTASLYSIGRQTPLSAVPPAAVPPQKQP